MSKPLRDELRAAGASAKEARMLSSVAKQLTALKEAHGYAPQPLPKRPIWLRLAPAVTVAAVCLIIGMAAVATAQASIPGNWLYPVKRLSENTAASIVPSYHTTLMMRRADEVKQLVGKHANSKRVLATLAAYTAEANAYKTKNYAAYSYCKNNLVQAETSASPTEKQQISSTLVSLSDIN